MNQIEEVKSKVDIVDIVGERVTLTKAGSNFKGLCPFHNEKTPSFMVTPDLQLFKCFGCGEGGDVFAFLQKYEGIEFGEALKILADLAGVKLEYKGKSETGSEKEIFYKANETAARFYNYILLNHALGKSALNYLLTERKLSQAAIKTFMLGFAPDSPTALQNYLINKKKFKKSDLEKSGLIVNARGRYFDRFHGRVIFPLQNHRNEFVALAGRILPSIEKFLPAGRQVAKYINSPETPIYHKSQTLYGLNVTKQDIKKAGAVIIVEGEIDLISSWMIDIKNIVAIKGSAVTVEQAKILSRFAKEAILALDSDFAGNAAARRGIQILEDAGLAVSVAKVPDKDPDVAAKNSPEEYKKALANPVGVWDFIIDTIFAKHNAGTGTGKSGLSKEIIPILASISDSIVQAHYINVVARRLGVGVDAVTNELEKIKKTNTPVVATPEVKKAAKSRRQILEESALALIIKTQPELLKNKEIQAAFTTPFAKSFLNADLKNLPEELKPGLADLILKITEEDPEKLQKEMEDSLKHLFILDIDEKRKKAGDDLKQVKHFNQKKEEFEKSGISRIIGKS